MRPERLFWLAWLHVIALGAWAIAQPLFSVLRQHPTWLAAHRIDAFSIAMLTVAAVFAMPIAIGALGLLTARIGGPTWGRRLLQTGLGCLVVLTLLPVARLVPGSNAWPLGLILVAGLGTAMAWHRCRPLRLFFTALLSGVILFPAWFVGREPVRTLIAPGTVANAPVSPLPASVAPTVVFVVLDELPVLSLLDSELQIDGHRFPGFARWAATSTWYRNATTVADATAQAVPALLTGKLPTSRKAPTAASHPDNLFTRSARAGLPLNVIETQTALCPPSLCGDQPTESGRGSHCVTMDLLADAAAVYLAVVTPSALHARLGLPPIDRGWRGFWRRPVNPSAPPNGELPLPEPMVRLLAGLETRPAGLHFAHLLLPHVPWDHLPSGRRYDGNEIPGLVNHLWTGDPWLVTQAYQRHLLQLGYVDAVLDALRRRLEALDLFDSALVVLVADHGVSFIPHQSWRRITPTNAAEIANVPLLIKYSGQHHGKIDDRMVETIDVLPTVLAQIDQAVLHHASLLPRLATFDGHDLNDPSWTTHRASAVRRCFVSRLRVAATPLDLPLDWLDRRQARLAWKVQHLGEGTDSLLRIGPHAELVGRPIADLDIATHAGDVRVTFDTPTTGTSSIPARLTGIVRGVASADITSSPIPLVIAINGRIWASTRTHLDRGTVRFSAMIDAFESSSLPAPPVAFVVTETETGYRLLPTVSTP